MRALIVEDDAEISRHLASVMQGAGWSTHCVGNLSDGFEQSKSGAFDLVIMDRMLPDGDGLQTVEHLRADGLVLPVLMLTALGRTEDKIEGYKRGADDYLAKPYDGDELLARVGALMRRSRGQVRTDLKVFEDIELHIKARKAHRDGRHLSLSPKEFDLLHYLVDNAGAIVTRDMLLRHVWNLSFDPGTNVIDVNVGRLRRKLDTDFERPILQTVRGVGFRLSYESPASINAGSGA